MVIATQRGQDRLAGQVVIVTGGGGVIGRAICAAFGHAGALVAAADRAADLLAGTVSSRRGERWACVGHSA